MTDEQLSIDPKLAKGKREYPCHEHPRESWCDRDGPGGFMGHTCVERWRAHLERDLDYQASRLRMANDELNLVERAYGDARRKLEAFEKRYGQ